MGEIRSKGFPRYLYGHAALTRAGSPYANGLPVRVYRIPIDSYCKRSGKILVWYGTLTLNQAPRPITILLSYTESQN